MAGQGNGDFIVLALQQVGVAKAVCPSLVREEKDVCVGGASDPFKSPCWYHLLRFHPLPVPKAGGEAFEGF